MTGVKSYKDLYLYETIMLLVINMVLKGITSI